MVERNEGIVPFAMRFQEGVSEEDIIQVRGEYNAETQVWGWPTDPRDPSMVMSFPQQEHPATTCIRPTQITEERVRADTVVDD